MKDLAKQLAAIARRCSDQETTEALDRLVAKLPKPKVDPNGFYQLGQPLDEVVPGHVLAGATRVYWCCIEQKWRS